MATNPVSRWSLARGDLPPLRTPLGWLSFVVDTLDIPGCCSLGRGEERVVSLISPWKTRVCLLLGRWLLGECFIGTGSDCNGQPTCLLGLRHRARGISHALSHHIYTHQLLFHVHSGKEGSTVQGPVLASGPTANHARGRPRSQSPSTHVSSRHSQSP